MYIWFNVYYNRINQAGMIAIWTGFFLLFSMFGREVLDWYSTPIRPIYFKRLLNEPLEIMEYI